MSAWAWHPDENNCTEPATCTPGPIQQDYDLDVCMWEEAGAVDILIGCSSSWDNNYELIDTDMKTDGTGYYMTIHVYTGTPNTTVTVGSSGHEAPGHAGRAK